MHSQVATDQPAEVVRVTGEHNSWAGAERSCSDKGVYCVARVEPVSTQKLPASGRDRAIGVEYGQPPQHPVDPRLGETP